jgi:hypothetical protein
LIELLEVDDADFVNGIVGTLADRFNFFICLWS